MNEATPVLRAAKGERLPNVPHLTAALNTDYEFSQQNLRPTLGATVRHVGSRTASYNASTSPPQYRLPSYTTVDLRSGLTFGSVTAQLYVHNLFDKRGEIPPRLSGSTPAAGPYSVGITQPRTIGVTVYTDF
jgi:iron complex outermembrane receptor protein